MKGILCWLSAPWSPGILPAPWTDEQAGLGIGFQEIAPGLTVLHGAVPEVHRYQVPASLMRVIAGGESVVETAGLLYQRESLWVATGLSLGLAEGAAVTRLLTRATEHEAPPVESPASFLDELLAHPDFAIDEYDRGEATNPADRKSYVRVPLSPLLLGAAQIDPSQLGENDPRPVLRVSGLYAPEDEERPGGELQFTLERDFATGFITADIGGHVALLAPFLARCEALLRKAADGAPAAIH